MKKIKKFFLVMYTLCTFIRIVSDCGVTYASPPGRMGDQLITYIKAKWLAWKHGYELLYVPFKGANMFEFHKKETRSTRLRRKQFYRTCSIKNDRDFIGGDKKNILYKIWYTFKSTDWGHWYDQSTWRGLSNNALFKQVLKKSLAPICKIEKQPVPQNCLTIALHVRRGGGYDKPLLSGQKDLYKPVEFVKKPHQYTKASTVRLSRKRRWLRRRGARKRRKKRPQYADRNHPLKFPPDLFYVHALIFLSEWFDDQPLYVYIFTDDIHPEKITENIQKHVKKQNITFDFRKEKNTHDLHVLDDMFNMSRFDCIIRPESSYSKVAELVGDHIMSIFPHKAVWHGNTLHIPEVVVVYKNKRKVYECA